METILENVPDFIKIAVGLVGVFAIIATMTPNTADNAIADKALKFVNMLAANFGRAKNS